MFLLYKSRLHPSSLKLDFFRTYAEPLYVGWAMPTITTEVVSKLSFCVSPVLAEVGKRGKGKGNISVAFSSLPFPHLYSR
jgi:hypothetical protein